MEDEKDAFYVVRKGDIIGVYRSLSECQEQAGSSVCHPSTSVYKGYGWPKGAEELLASFGLKNALFSINASYVKDDVFGKLIPFPIQQPSSSQGAILDTPDPSKRSHDKVGYIGVVRLQPYSDNVTSSPPTKQRKIENGLSSEVAPSNHESFTIEFDGASKGNPGKAGSGAVLRASDGSVISFLREGVGIATNNVAEYRGLILGLKFALAKGFRHVKVYGDSKLVCKQIQDEWIVKDQKMVELCKRAKELKRQFKSFHIEHIGREYNSEADSQANYAIYLEDGQTKEIPGKKLQSSDPFLLGFLLSLSQRRQTTSDMDKGKRHCIIEFDGASKGNPGRAGSGAVLRDSDGSVISSYREGLGKATNNEAEYRGLNRGLESALAKGYTDVKVYGDSELVVKQTRGEWKVRAPNLSELSRHTQELKNQFKSVDIQHVPRGYNSEADSHANEGTYLQDGEIQEIPGNRYYY